MNRYKLPLRCGKKAKAGLEIAEKSYKRVKNLADQGVMSAQKLDEVTAQRDAAPSLQKKPPKLNTTWQKTVRNEKIKQQLPPW